MLYLVYTSADPLGIQDHYRNIPYADLKDDPLNWLRQNQRAFSRKKVAFFNEYTFSFLLFKADVSLADDET